MGPARSRSPSTRCGSPMLLGMSYVVCACYACSLRAGFLPVISLAYCLCAIVCCLCICAGVCQTSAASACWSRLFVAGSLTVLLLGQQLMPQCCSIPAVLPVANTPPQPPLAWLRTHRPRRSYAVRLHVVAPVATITGVPLTLPRLWRQGPVMCVAISASGRLLASGSLDQTVRVWNARLAFSVC